MPELFPPPLLTEMVPNERLGSLAQQAAAFSNAGWRYALHSSSALQAASRGCSKLAFRFADDGWRELLGCSGLARAAPVARPGCTIRLVFFANFSLVAHLAEWQACLALP